MTRQQVVELLNNSQIDVSALFERYVSHGGTIRDINEFNRFLQVYIRYEGLESIYYYALIDHSICKLYSAQGEFIKYH